MALSGHILLLNWNQQVRACVSPKTHSVRSQHHCKGSPVVKPWVHKTGSYAVQSDGGKAAVVLPGHILLLNWNQ